MLGACLSRAEAVGVQCERLLVSLRYKLVRGALDFGGVVNRATGRSRYGGSPLRCVPLGVTTNPIEQPRSQNRRLCHNHTARGSTAVHNRRQTYLPWTRYPG